MKLLLEIEEGKGTHLIELLKDLPYVTAKPFEEDEPDATEHELSSEKNKQWLDESIKQLKAGKYAKRELLD